VKTLRPADGTGFGRFSPDGRFLAVGDLPGRVQVFATATWKPVTPSFAGGRAARGAFARDGRTLASGNTDGTVRLWDVASSQALGAPLPGVPNSQVVPIFTPDGRHLIAAHQNGRAYRWDIRPASLVRQACDVAGRQLTREEWDESCPVGNMSRRVESRRQCRASTSLEPHRGFWCAQRVAMASVPPSWRALLLFATDAGVSAG
jgi:hypothetical protein